MPSVCRDKLIDIIYNEPDVVWLDSTRLHQGQYSYLFYRPRYTIKYYPNNDLNLFFRQIETAVGDGLWLAGYFNYEFGYYLEESLKQCRGGKKNIPLVWLGAFSREQVLQFNPGFLRDIDSTSSSRLFKGLTTNISQKSYLAALERIKKYVYQGQTYQVNFSFKITGELNVSALELYLKLRKFQPTNYSAFIRNRQQVIVSFSPELFFKRDGSSVTTAPMKGTTGRGHYRQEDNFYRHLLRNSSKNRAENLMIVDLLRNDLGRIARRGGVSSEQLFAVEQYPSLMQMISYIKAECPATLRNSEIIKALFPCGSVTGAPKIRTMQIIQELEAQARNIYCGAIGYFSPQQQAVFNVAIRTGLIRGNNFEFGVGGGIVADSDSKEEYQEALLKASFLTSHKKFPHYLIETISWRYPQGYQLLDLHFKRLKYSCEYFGIKFYSQAIKEKLTAVAAYFHLKPHKVRLLVFGDGNFYIHYNPLSPAKKLWRVKISSFSVCRDNVFLYHKTSNRGLFNRQREQAQQQGFDEILFTNRLGALTEGTVSNIFLLFGNKFYTPALSSGLLPGVLREKMIKQGGAVEKELYPQDIINADKLFLGNSVRGLVEGLMVC